MAGGCPGGQGGGWRVEKIRSLVGDLSGDRTLARDRAHRRHRRRAARDGYRYALKRRNYDLLRGPTQVPRLLVVLALPEDAADWLHISSEELIMRRCAYWVSLAGAPETDNTTSVTVSVPAQNRFDLAALGALMAQSRTGVIQ